MLTFYVRSMFLIHSCCSGIGVLSCTWSKNIDCHCISPSESQCIRNHLTLLKMGDSSLHFYKKKYIYNTYRRVKRNLHNPYIHTEQRKNVKVPEGVWLRSLCLRNMKCTVHDLEVICSNPSWVELGVFSTSVQVVLEPKWRTLVLI